MQGGNQADLRKVSEEFLQKIQTLETSKDWKLKDEKPVEVYSMQKEGRILIKGSLIINLPFETVLHFFEDPFFMKKLQDSIIKAELLYNKDGLKVVHTITKLPGPISNRQIVAVNTTKIIGNKAYCGNRSCNFPVQHDKDCVLAQLHAAAFILEKVDGKTKVTNISDIDPKGSIPDFVKNAMAGKRVEVMLELENVIRKNTK